MNLSYRNYQNKNSLISKSDSFKYFQTGFTIPMSLIFVVVFLIIPLLFWSLRSKSEFEGQVKGADTDTQKLGATVKVISEGGPWDLFEYLCKTEEECLKGLESGKKLTATSGGATAGSEVSVVYADSMSDYQYVKVFVREGWGMGTNAGFSLKNTDAKYQKINNVTVLLIPVEDLKAKHSLFVFEKTL